MAPGMVFMPAELVVPVTASILPESIVWDMSPCEKYVDSMTESVIFPPIFQTGWQDLNHSLREIRIDANVGDPRFLTHGQPREYQPVMLPMDSLYSRNCEIRRSSPFVAA